MSENIAFPAPTFIQGTEADDSLVITTEELKSVTRIDGGNGDDSLVIQGAVIDLTNKDIFRLESIYVYGATVTTDSKVTAQLIHADVHNDKLILTQSTLSYEERRDLHWKGFEIIEARNEHGDVVTSTMAMSVGSLDGDHSSGGGGGIFLDAGQNATINSALDIFWLEVQFKDDAGSPQHGIFGLDTSAASGVTLSNGLAKGSKVSVDGIEIGSLERNVQDLSNGISFVFYDGNSALVQKLIRALTYSNTVDTSSTPFDVEILMSTHFGAEASATITVDLMPPPPNNAPTSISLSQTALSEMIEQGGYAGTLRAVDPDFDSLTFTLLDNAEGHFEIRGDTLFVAKKLDYEKATSHVIKILVTDPDGLSYEQTIKIDVLDVQFQSGLDFDEADLAKLHALDQTGKLTATVESMSGTTGNDVITGGIGSDRISGFSGRDNLTGGLGKDVFVFDTAVSKRMNVNFDTITDFFAKDDSIHLDNAVFRALGKKGSINKPAHLSKEAFWKGAKAHDASDRIVYNQKTGTAFYDEDGNGKIAAIKLFILKNKPANITENDFFVI